MNRSRWSEAGLPRANDVSIPPAPFHRRKFVPGCGIRFAAVALALALSTVAAASGQVSTPDAHGAPSVAADDEKQRVPKPPPDQPKTKKPDTAGSTPGSTSAGDGADTDPDFATSCLEGCLGSCLEGLFDAVLQSIFHHDEVAPALADSAMALAADSPGAADSSWAAEPYEPHAWARLDVGYLRAYVAGDSVVMRHSPSDPDSVMLEAGRLPDGARVLVTDTRAHAGGTMLEVRPVDSQGPSGWVNEKSVRQTTSGPSLPEETPADSLAGAGATAAPAEITLPASPPRWAMTYSAGIAWIDNPELAKEYKYGGPVFEVEYLRCLRPSWVAGAGAGYRELAGYPTVEYEGPTEIDVPSESSFGLPYATVEFGQRHAWRSGFRFGYMAGPVIARVHEDADIVVLDAGTRQSIGARQEVLNRWTWGGGAVLWTGWALPAPYELALRFRIFGLAWDGHREKSLTSDYTDEALLHYDFALTFTHTNR